MATENEQITSNLNSNNSQTNYLYMELFHVDDSNEVFSGFRIQWPQEKSSYYKRKRNLHIKIVL